MESHLTVEIENLSAKIARIVAQRDEANAGRKAALEEVATLKREIETLKEELHKKDLDIEFLTLSHKLADTPQKLADSRVTVKNIINRVDKAIALLKQDARL